MQARITNEVPAELVCEFLEVVTHEILYLRKIYTPEIFERERLYGIVVHKSRHPELNLYVSDALLSLKVSSQPSHAYLSLQAFFVPKSPSLTGGHQARQGAAGGYPHL